MADTRITGVKCLDKISNSIASPTSNFGRVRTPSFYIPSMDHTLKLNTILSQMDQDLASFPPLETTHPIVYMLPGAAADGKQTQDSHKLTARLILEVIVSSSFPRVY